jgi:DNA polymerase III alpha subunit (gram-positive type)
MTVLAPHLILSRAELKGAVAALSQHDAFSFDVETTGLDTRTNWVTWIGLASYGQCYRIPMGHRIGRLRRHGYTEKVLPPEEERETLQSGKLSQRKITRKVPPVYYPVPNQLDPAIVFQELEPLFFGDQIKVAFNARFDLMSIAKYYGGIVPEPPYEDPMIMTHVLDENRVPAVALLEARSLAARPGAVDAHLQDRDELVPGADAHADQRYGH